MSYRHVLPTQDRPSLPLRVIHKPGALAAGIETLLTVELVAEMMGDFVGEVGGWWICVCMTQGLQTQRRCFRS